MVNALGKRGEDLACEFLQRVGYKIIGRNFRIIGGEIDIVAWDGQVVVFVEVKTRSSNVFGTPFESITISKIKTLHKAAQFYLQKNRWLNKPYRIDVVGVDFTLSYTSPQIELVKNITS